MKRGTRFHRPVPAAAYEKLLRLHDGEVHPAHEITGSGRGLSYGTHGKYLYGDFSVIPTHVRQPTHIYWPRHGSARM